MISGEYLVLWLKELQPYRNMINSIMKTDVCTYICNGTFLSLLNNIKYYNAIKAAKMELYYN